MFTSTQGGAEMASGPALLAWEDSSQHLMDMRCVLYSHPGHSGEDKMCD